MKQQNEMVPHQTNTIYDAGHNRDNTGNVYEALRELDKALEILEDIYTRYLENPKCATTLIKRLLDDPECITGWVLCAMRDISDAHKKILPLVRPSVQAKYERKYEENSMYQRCVEFRIWDWDLGF